MEGIEVALWRFGDDERSTLMDQFEVLSFKIQLNQAMLRRSISEPSGARQQYSVQEPSTLSQRPPLPPLVRQEVRQGKRGSMGISKVLMKLLKPIIRRKEKRKEEAEQEPLDFASSVRLSKSVRL
ncbi:hypothetical protein Nepgr_011888 [Nepenthes gracilis]|uniref:Uncharacterized protein n=1 Tax=Nepenthes gracilis TaxID=150966 RepID=A0AAD3XMD0_NEPGR|nr:hypothetical protein Nepgr_011888 [Nepenthes gracilis]